MITFPNAKINIGLNIIEKRPDSYHNLESCFYPISWSDILEIVPTELLRFSSSGIFIPGDEDNNLCLQAYNLIKREHNISPVNIHLHKVIPIGAGLGGGSADGAFTLKMLDELFQLSLSTEQLESYAGQLGSDCPFFIQNQPKYVTGTGNILHNISLDLSNKHIVIVQPNIHISTAEAYAGIQPHHPTSNIKNLIEEQPISAWKDSILNDFEHSIFPNHVPIAGIKAMLYEKGAIYASMTGSGAAVLGIFDNAVDIQSNESIVWKGLL